MPRARVVVPVIVIISLLLAAGAVAEGKHAVAGIIAGAAVGAIVPTVWKHRGAVLLWAVWLGIVTGLTIHRAGDRWSGLFTRHDVDRSTMVIALIAFFVAGIMVVPGVAMYLYRRLADRPWAWTALVSAATSVVYLGASGYVGGLAADSSRGGNVSPLFFVLVASAGHVGSLVGGGALAAARGRTAPTLVILTPASAYVFTAAVAPRPFTGSRPDDVRDHLLLASVILAFFIALAALTFFCAFVPAGRRFDPRLELAAIATIYVVLIAAFRLFSDGFGPAPLVVVPTRVSAPYEMDAFYETGYWRVTERWTVDDEALAKLRALKEEDWSGSLKAAVSPRASFPDAELMDVIKVLRRDSATKAAALVRKALKISAPEADCLVSGCRSADKILDGLCMKVIEDDLAEGGWRTLDVTDEATRFVRSELTASDVPVLGGRTTAISFTTTRLHGFRGSQLGGVYLTPRGDGSRLAVRAPKGMVIDTYPPAAGGAPTLAGKEEQFLVDLQPGAGELRLHLLAWLLRSQAGHAAYRAAQWPWFPYLLALVAALGLYLVRAWFAALVERRRADSVSARNPA